MRLVGWGVCVTLPCHHSTMFQDDESCRSPHRPSASPHARTRAPRAQARRACLPLTLKTPPCLSFFLAHRERQPSLVVDRVVGRQLPLHVVTAAHRSAPTTHWLLSRGGQQPRRWRRSCTALPALATTSPSSITTGPARSEDEQSRLSCGPGRVDRPRRRRRSATRGGRSRAGKHRRRAFRGALHASRRCECRRGLVASSRLRLPQFLAFSNTFFETASAATLPRRQILIRLLRPRSTLGLRRRRRRRTCRRIGLPQRQLLV